MSGTTYRNAAEIAALADAFRACTLSKESWTHAAHFAATMWLIARAPDITLERDMPDMIRRYNASVGGVNSDTAGYHETITQASIAATRHLLAGRAPDEPLHESHAALMAGPLGKPGWLLAYWSKDILMGAPARRAWIAPDIAPLPFPCAPTET